MWQCGDCEMVVRRWWVDCEVVVRWWRCDCEMVVRWCWNGDQVMVRWLWDGGEVIVRRWWGDCEVMLKWGSGDGDVIVRWGEVDRWWRDVRSLTMRRWWLQWEIYQQAINYFSQKKWLLSVITCYFLIIISAFPAFLEMPRMGCDISLKFQTCATNTDCILTGLATHNQR